jgi:hypothetical protein
MIEQMLLTYITELLQSPQRHSAKARNAILVCATIFQSAAQSQAMELRTCQHNKPSSEWVEGKNSPDDVNSIAHSVSGPPLSLGLT